MTTQNRLRGLALGAVALMMAAAPAAVVAQPYYDRDAQYEAQQRDYQARQAQWERDRRDYDRRYGRGSYDRYYAAHSGEYQRTDREACHDEKKGNAVGGAILGGIAGAVIGSNVARGGGREGGAIIGGVGGAALGSSIAKNSTHCDDGRY
jgi:hypothetical protein